MTCICTHWLHFCVHTPTGEDRALFYWDLLFRSWHQAASSWVCFPQGLIPEKWLERHGFYCCVKWVSDISLTLKGIQVQIQIEFPLFMVIIQGGWYKCSMRAKLHPCQSIDALLNANSFIVYWLILYFQILALPSITTSNHWLLLKSSYQAYVHVHVPTACSELCSLLINASI